jgi:glutamate transport system substrate-binding protein
MRLKKRGLCHRPPAVLAAASIVVLAACGAGGSSSGGVTPVTTTFAPQTTMAKLAAAGEIKVGIKQDQPLQGLMGLDGKPTGFDVEIAKLIAAALGIPSERITWVEAPSKVREQYIAQGRTDIVVATYTISPKRLKQITMAGPYYRPGQGLMARKGDPKVTGLTSLSDSDRKVCAGVGSTGADLIKKYLSDPGRQLVQFDELSKCGDALRNGQVDAVTADTGILAGIVHSAKGDFEILGSPYAPNDYGIGMKKGDTAFCNFIDDVLTKAHQDGTFAKAWQQTLGQVLPEPPKLQPFIPCA